MRIEKEKRKVSKTRKETKIKTVKKNNKLTKVSELQVIPENTSYFFLLSASLDEICSRTHFTLCYKTHVCRLCYVVRLLS